MTYFEVEMQHSEDSLLSLSRMQYDLFCMSNRIIRSLLSIALVASGVIYASQWWGILFVAYGCYLVTSTYSSSNHTARKLATQIKNSGQDFPHSKYIFQQDQMRIVSLPDGKELNGLPYSGILRMGEDLQYFYLFRDSYGGYMIPKELLDDKAQAFRQFLMDRSGKTFHSRQAPFLRLIAKLSSGKRN